MSSFGSFHLGPFIFKGRPTQGASRSGAYHFRHQDLGNGRHRIIIKGPKQVIRTTLTDKEWVRFIGGSD